MTAFAAAVGEFDKIFEQTYVGYDDAGNVLSTEFFQRFHDATGYGPLDYAYGSQPKARVSYQAQWYDGVGRQIAAASYGTNDNAAFTRPETVPARSDDVLVTTMGYDDAGRTFQSIDSADKETRREYDAADRVTKTIDNPSIPRKQVFDLATCRFCGRSVQVAFVDQGYTGENAAAAAQQHGIRLAVVKHTEAKRGFVLLPRRWVVERTFGWLGRFRRLARDYERLAETLRDWHWLAALTLTLKNYFSSA